MYVIPRIIKESANGFSSIALEDEMLLNREVQCIGEINDDSVNSLIKQLLFLQRKDPNGEITMFINSPGGEVNSGLALYDAMQAISCPIRTVCMGLAASMASVVFVSGDVRDMLPHSRIMIHDPLISQTGGSALHIKSICDDLMETRSIMAEVISKHSGRTIDEILEKTAHDSFFRAEQAIQFGLADNIITTINLKRGNDYVN